MADSFEYQKSTDELNEQLAHSIAQLRRSIDTYDAGHHDEAQRLAASVYALFSEQSGNRPVTRLLKIRSSLRFPERALI